MPKTMKFDSMAGIQPLGDGSQVRVFLSEKRGPIEVYKSVDLSYDTLRMYVEHWTCSCGRNKVKGGLGGPYCPTCTAPPTGWQAHQESEESDGN